MGHDPPRDGRGRVEHLRSGLSSSGLTMDELERACLCLGDTMTRSELGAVLSGARPPGEHRYNVIAQAINDELIERGRDHRVPAAGQSDADSSRALSRLTPPRIIEP